jgi:hypothetical protein
VNTGQAFACPVHKRHKLRTPTLAQSLEAIIYTHSLDGHPIKRGWRKALAQDILIFLRERNLEPQEKDV